MEKFTEHELYEMSHNRTMKIEGTYDNDPRDRGGETCMGIARNFHDDWDGWKIVDGMKKDPNFPNCLKGHEELHAKVLDFYKSKYWSKPNFDLVGEKLPLCSIELFDSGVNCGTERASKWLQAALNAFNNQEKYYDDIKEDGKIGKGTMGMVDALIKKRGTEKTDRNVFKYLNVLQGMHYHSIIQRREKMECYIWGWYLRVFDDDMIEIIYPSGKSDINEEALIETVTKATLSFVKKSVEESTETVNVMRQVKENLKMVK